MIDIDVSPESRVAYRTYAAAALQALIGVTPSNLLIEYRVLDSISQQADAIAVLMVARERSLFVLDTEGTT